MRTAARIATTASFLATLLTTSGRAASADPGARCVVRGDDVTIAHLTVNDFTIGVSHVKANATMVPGGKGSLVEIEGVVAFRANAPDLWYTVRAPTVAAGGMVTLAPGAHLIGERLDGDAIAGRAVIYASDVLEGEDKAPDESASTISVPCENLSLDWARDGADLTFEEGPGWRSKGASLVFHAAPKINAPQVTYAATSCEEDCLAVQGSAATNGFRKVAVVNEGVRIAGWVSAASLVRIPDNVLLAHSYGCSGDHASGMDLGFGFDSPTSLATLPRGTKIYDGPKGATWATITRETELRISVRRGESWALLRDLPGVTGFQGHAYVPVSSLARVRPVPAAR